MKLFFFLMLINMMYSKSIFSIEEGLSKITCFNDEHFINSLLSIYRHVDGIIICLRDEYFEKNPFENLKTDLQVGSMNSIFFQIKVYTWRNYNYNFRFKSENWLKNYNEIVSLFINI